MNYEIVKADSPIEAARKAKHQVGDTVEIVEQKVSANSDGTYTVRYEIGEVPA